MNIKSFLTGMYVLLLTSYFTQAMQPTQVALRTMLMRAAVQRSLHRLRTSSTESHDNKLFTINKNHPVTLEINNVLDKFRGFRLPESVRPITLSTYGLILVSGIALVKGFNNDELDVFLQALLVSAGGTGCLMGGLHSLECTCNDLFLIAERWALERQLEACSLSPEKVEEIAKLIIYYPTVPFGEDVLLKLLEQEDIADTVRNEIIDIYRKYKAKFTVEQNRTQRFVYERAKKNLKICYPELDDQQINSMALALIGKESSIMEKYIQDKFNKALVQK